MKENFIKRLKSGDRRVLAQAITLIESTLPEDREKAQRLLSEVKEGKKAWCIGITGAPGTGKSTFIEALGVFLVEQEKKIAVLAVDPSSPIGGGAILADKTRMGRLSRHPNAFVRPSASGAGYMGGLTPATGDVIAILESAGFDLILVETIGVGQNETAVSDFVDQLIYLISPANGDDLQAIKKGIMEVADMIVVTKDDQDMRVAAEQTAMSYASLTRKVPVLRCSAQEGRGIEEIWLELQKGFEHKRNHRQEKQRVRRFQEHLHQEVITAFLNNPVIRDLYPSILNQIRQGKLLPGDGVKQLMEQGRRV